MRVLGVSLIGYLFLIVEIVSGQVFTKVTNSELSNEVKSSNSSIWADFNSDGLIDLLVVNGQNQSNDLYINVANGSFQKDLNDEFNSELNSSFCVAIGDYQNDEFVDVAIANGLFQNNSFLTGSEEGIRFEDNSSNWQIINEGGFSNGVNFADINNDNFLDISFANNGNNFLYKNNEGTGFSAITSGSFISANQNSRKMVWADFNKDGFLDAYIANNGMNNLLKNNGDETFTEILNGEIVTDSENSFDICAGDFNNDGWEDFFVANDGTNSLYQNNGDETFTKITSGNLVTDSEISNACTFGDYDSDGDLDLILANDGNNSLYTNLGSGNFAKSLFTDGGNSKDVNFVDYDKDGDLDLFVANIGNNFFYTNNGNTNNWLSVKLYGMISNLSAIGAKVSLKANNSWQFREIKDENASQVYFGLGNAGLVDSLKIEWLSGEVEVYTNLTVNQEMKLVELRLPVYENYEFISDSYLFQKMNWVDFDKDGDLDIISLLPEPNSNSLKALILKNDNGNFNSLPESYFYLPIDFILNDIIFYDIEDDGDLDCFYFSNYSPHLLKSENGLFANSDSTVQDINFLNYGKSKFADFDKDGDLDLAFLTLHVSQYVNQFFIAKENETFEELTNDEFVNDVTISYDGEWFDFDNDGFQDIFVLNDSPYGDNRLYKNNANGSFTEIHSSGLTDDSGEFFYSSKGDYDNDGDLDIVVITSSNSNIKNYIYRNNGNGTFTNVSTALFGLELNQQMTDVNFYDFNNDGHLDIWFQGHKYYDKQNLLMLNNANGGFIKIANGKILAEDYQVFASIGDFDADGDFDFLIPYRNNTPTDNVVKNRIFESQGNGNNWLIIDCNGKTTNSSAFGSIVRVKATIDGNSFWQMRQIEQELNGRIHFGLGDAVVVDSIIVEWFKDKKQVLTNVSVNQLLEITEEKYIVPNKLSEKFNGIKSSYGNSWADYDNDGDLDLFVPNAILEDNSFFINQSSMDFISQQNGILVNENGNSISATWGDYDNDGFLDLFVANWNNEDNFLYHNEGNGTFTKITNSSVVTDGGFSTSGTWADIDGDNDLDLFVTNWNGQFNFLYTNDGSGNFTKVTNGEIVTDGGNSYGASWADIDGDNDLDLFVPNWAGNNFLYTNEGNGNFTKIITGEIVTDGGNSYGASWGDFDADGDFDLFVTNGENQNNFLYQNDGNGNFTKLTNLNLSTDGGNSRGSSWVDFDGDSDLDLYVTNSNQRNFLYINNGSGNFTKQNYGKIVNDFEATESCSWIDFDNDGDLDLFSVNWDGEKYLFENSLEEKNWLSLKLSGVQSNTFAIGSRVKVKANGVWQTREITTQSGRYSQSGFRMNFGLGNATLVDSILIHWSSGNVETFTNLQINESITITEGFGVTDLDEVKPQVVKEFELLQNYPNPFNPKTTIQINIPQEGGFIELSIFNVKGQKVNEIFKGQVETGTKKLSWKGIDFSGKELASGVYFARLKTGKSTLTRKMLLLK